MKLTTWLWPNRIIRKRESARLRADHNSLYYAFDQLRDLTVKVSRSACLDQNSNGKCICFACESRRLLDHIEQNF